MTRDADEADTLPGSVDDLTLGVDSVLGREVAMVSLPPARGEALALRTEQVRRLAGLHHPNLIEVYDVDGLAEDTASTLVLQSVEGHPLDGSGARRSWSAVSVAHIGAQVADGLAHAHGHGVVHGGVGPASIVVDESLHAWLTGFTAALRPAPETTPADPGPADGHAASPDGDVTALAVTLRTLLDDTAEVPAVLDDALAAMHEGGVDARAAAGALARAADACAHGGGTGGVVPLAVHTARIVTTTASSPAGGIPAPVEQPATPTPLPTPLPLPSPTPPPVAVSPSPPRARRRWAPGRGLRTTVLGGAAASLAVASGAVLWATNSFSAPLDEPVSAPAGALDPAAGVPVTNPAPAAPVVGPPSVTDEPITDVTTLESDSTQEAADEPAVTPSTEAPPSAGPALEGPPLAPPPWVHPRPPVVEPPPSSEPTPPPSSEPTPPPSSEPTPPPSSEPTPPPSSEPTPPPSSEPTPPPSSEPTPPPSSEPTTSPSSQAPSAPSGPTSPVVPPASLQAAPPAL